MPERNVVVAGADPCSAEVMTLVSRYVSEVEQIVGSGADGPVRELELHQELFLPPAGAFFVARDEYGTPVGCGGIQTIQTDTAEVRRLWVDPACRGRGVGRQLLAVLEAAARDLGARRVVLDTHGELRAAVRLYVAAGWQPVPRYNDDTPATHWFGKDLG